MTLVINIFIFLSLSKREFNRAVTFLSSIIKQRPSNHYFELRSKKEYESMPSGMRSSIVIICRFLLYIKEKKLRLPIFNNSLLILHFEKIACYLQHFSPFVGIRYLKIQKRKRRRRHESKTRNRMKNREKNQRNTTTILQINI